MTKTSLDVCNEALRRIGVLAVDENAAAEDRAVAKLHLDAVLAEVAAAPNDMGFTWDAETVPDAAFRPLAWLVAVDTASAYQRQAEPRSRALMRLRAYAFPDDRDDPADYDSDGTVTDAEQDAYDRAAYF